MNVHTEGNSSLWPFGVNFKLAGESNDEGVIELRAGITTLVGPNGSGKTRALRAVQSALQLSGVIHRLGRKIQFLAAGRSSPLERYRAAVEHPSANSDDAAVGHLSYHQNWWLLESITGSLLCLDRRADLRLKVEARLQQLFDRSAQFSWSQNGLTVRMSPMAGGSSYPANYEASGILHLVGLLAAIHNDEVGALLIDEPEISLHPQHQAFLLEEIEAVAGDPTDPARKIVVIATHSPSMLPLRKIRDLPSIAFFNSAIKPPTQVPADSQFLKRDKLASLVTRLSTTHRMAVFAERVLLVEGISDEIIATQLARRLDLRLLARNAQILPVMGKSEFVEAAKLFRLMNKQVAVLADLDALSDDNSLVCHFSELPEASLIADELGRINLADLDKDLRTSLEKFMTKHSALVDVAADAYSDWSSNDSAALSKRRVTLARVLTDSSSFGAAASADAARLCTQYNTLLGGLSKLGCFFLCRGAIENYYRIGSSNKSKTELAVAEAAQFESTDVKDLERDYLSVFSALSHIAPNQRVDEDQLLRPKLGAALTATFLSMAKETSDAQLNTFAQGILRSDAEVFKLTNRSIDGDLRLEVHMASPLFQRTTFPFVIGSQEHVNVIVNSRLPGIKKA